MMDNIIKIILYGSVARNENTDESDIDIQEKNMENSKDTYDIEQALDEADLLAENSNERMTHEEVFHALKSRVTIPFPLHGIEEMLTVEYNQGTDPREIGYDALQGFPIAKICCKGYPAEIFDAHCGNLAGCRLLKWTAYACLVDLPSRMNSNKLKFLGGYSWGYEEDENGPQRSLPLEILTENDWEKHATEKGILKISQITGGCTAKL